MKPIPTLYLREPNDLSRLSEDVDPVCQWVLDEWETGAVRATEKIDGTCCLVRDGILYKRHTVRKRDRSGRMKSPETQSFPETWWHYSTEPGHLLQPDETILYGPGWVLVDVALPTNRWHSEAWDTLQDDRVREAGPHRKQVEDGTYELIGPKVEGNRYGLPKHRLSKHGSRLIEEPPDPRQSSLYVFLEVRNRGPAPLEGIVWHRANGDKCKIKARDFGVPWKELKR